MTLKKLHLPNCGKDNYLLPDLQMTKFGLCLGKTFSCDVVVSIIFYAKHCRVMVIRRGDITDIAWVFARLEMNCLITSGDVLIICHYHVIAKCFGK